jgi:hypothetical protein
MGLLYLYLYKISSKSNGVWKFEKRQLLAKIGTYFQNVLCIANILILHLYLFGTFRLVRS